MHLVPLARWERIVIKTFDVVSVDLCEVLVFKVHSFSFVFEVVVLGISFGTRGNIWQGAVRSGSHISSPDVRYDGDGGSDGSGG